MSLQAKTISRDLEYEIIDTHVTDFAILYVRWADASSEFRAILGTRKKLEATIKKMIDLPAARMPLLQKGKDRTYYPFFCSPDLLAQMQEHGGLLSTMTDADKLQFDPDAWGKAPPQDMILLAHSGWDNTYIHPDGTYAVTSYREGECWSEWQRTKLAELIEQENVPIRFVRKSYFVPGNGDMFDVVVTLDQEQFARFRDSRIPSYQRIDFALEAFGHTPADYRKTDA